MRKQRGWTLMETLVALAIFVLFTVILFPAIKQMWPANLGLAIGIAACFAAGITPIFVAIWKRGTRTS